MNKRELGKLPILPAPTIKEGHPRFIVAAYKHENVLVMNFYHVENKKAVYAFRCFGETHDYMSQDADGKWKTGSIMYLCNHSSMNSQYWWNLANIEIVEGEQLVRDTISEWLGKDIDNTMKAVEQWQEKVREERLAKKHKKETDVIDSYMEKFGDIPEDYQTFTEKVLFADENYMFYSTKKKKAYCSKCGWDFDIENDGKRLSNKIGIWSNDNLKISHNKHVSCPYCHTYLQAKNENMSRGNITAIKWSVLVQSSGDDVLVRYFCHVKDFRNDYRNPKYTRSEQLRTYHTKDKSIDFEWGRFKQTNKVRWIYQKMNYGNYWAPSELVLPRSVTLYNINIDEDLKDTCMKYSCAGTYFKFIDEKSQDPRNHISPYIVDLYFNAYRKYAWIEQLIKCGMVELAEELLSEYKLSDVLKNIKAGRTICETLDISKNIFNILKMHLPVHYRDIEIMKYYREIRGKDIQDKEFTSLRYVHDNGHTDMYKKYIDMLQYTTLHKIDRYMSEQKIHYPADYFDYIEWIRDMGYNMKNEFNLFPKDFKKSHDEKSKEYMKFKNKKQLEEIKRFNKLLKQMRQNITEDDPLAIKTAELFIRLPASLGELTKEGEALHHCVGTCKERVAKGQTMIYFIRRIEEPDKPYYTLEYKDGKIAQCRGSHNCDMTPEVKAFTTLFSEKMHEYEEKAV